MRWKGRQQSRNVEDRRGSGGRGIPRRAGRVGGGLGVVGVVAAVVIYLMGGDPSALLSSGSGGGSGVSPSPRPQTSQPYQGSKKEEELKDFVSVVLQDTEDAWDKIFKEQVSGAGYQDPNLVIFNDQVSSACGLADAGTGPFYCPGDDRVYLDLSFSDELKNNFGADGDFALAYVIAHEVGHHVQNLLGTLQKVQREKARSSEAQKNALQVRVELQADFYAGVWAHYTQKMKNVLDTGDLQEAINAAQAVGDDRIQKRSRGYVVPESFTHGTSAQRARWFKKGYSTGRLTDGDTFNAKSL